MLPKVVTFKRLEPSSETNSLNRKRKKPGGTTGPNPTGNKDLASSPNDALLPNDADKAFYENLPFHNMANPQNKASRPPSRISSGYGSSRSQKIARPARKFLTVRPLGSKPKNWPQFRSLRLTKARNQPPVPAPRQYFPKTPLAYHSYQNVPPPKNVSKTSPDSNAKNETNDTENSTTSVCSTSPHEIVKPSLQPSGGILPSTSVERSSQVPTSLPSVYKQPPPKPLQIPSLKAAASLPNPPSLLATLPPSSTNTVQASEASLVKKLPSLAPAPISTPKPYPLTLSVASLITSSSPNSLPATTINTKLYPVSRTPSISSQTSRPAKPKLTYSTGLVTTPLVRHSSDAQRTPGAQLQSLLSLVTPKQLASGKQFASVGRTPSLLVTRKPSTTSTNSPSKPTHSNPTSPTSVRLLNPVSLPPSSSIVRRLSSAQRPDSSTENKVPVITGVVSKKSDETPPRNDAAPMNDASLLSKSDCEDQKGDEPYRPQYPDMEYADVDYRSYGPINYKAASMYNAQQKQNEEELL